MLVRKAKAEANDPKLLGPPAINETHCKNLQEQSFV